MSFFSGLTSLKLWALRQEGAVAIIFAFTLIPLLAITTIAVEMGRYIYVDTRLAAAVDSATIAAARFQFDDPQAIGSKFFYANFENGFMGVDVTPVITLDADQRRLTVSASSEMPTIIGKYLGVHALKLSASAAALREFLGLEIALVLDVTGSMAGSKITALREAAKNFIDTIYGDQNTREKTAISIVPYVMSVNVGSDKVGWLIDPETVTGPRVSWTGNSTPTPSYNAGKTRLFPVDITASGASVGKWKGCVMNRTHGVKELNDDPPSVQKWFAYFADPTPRSTKGTQYDNDWLGGKPGKWNPDDLSRIRSEDNGLADNDNRGPNRSCGPSIMPLTNNRDALKATIDTLVPIYGGGTDGTHILWGWRTISPRWAGLWGGETIHSYDEPSHVKAVVFMTDGENQWYDNPNPRPVGDPTAYISHVGNTPQRYKNHLTLSVATATYPGVPLGSSTGRQFIDGATTESTTRTKINTNLATACQLIKQQGIEVYTVVFQVNNAQTQQIYKDCATTEQNYYLADDSTQLFQAFQSVAQKLSRIRIVR